MARSRWRSLVLIATGLALFAGLDSTPALAGEGVRLLTYNVTNLDVDTPRWRVRELADDLERLDADIVFLQEVASLAAARVLQRELAQRSIERYDVYEVDTPWSDQEVALLTRYRPRSFRRYDFAGLSTALDRTAYADFDLPGGTLRAVAVHLKAGIQSEQDARTRNYQAREVVDDVVRPALAAGSYCVLLGDFNDIDREVAYANGRRPHPASRVFETVRAIAPQLRNTDADLPVRERISSSLGYMYDHFLVDERLAARVFVDRASTNDGVQASDHWPVVLDLAPLGATPVREASTPARVIPAAGTVDDTLHVAQLAGGGDVLRDVSVRLVISHPRPDDLEVRLLHGGRSAVLLEAGDHEQGGRALDRRVVTRAFEGVPAAGAWTLDVRDRGHPGATSGGRLATWELHTAAD